MTSFRVGTGYDAHPLVPGRRLMLGGVHIPHEKGLEGHSDSDVVCHAIVDALLGAAGLGDIGTFFPPSDARYKDAPSLTFVEFTAKKLAEARWRIGNVDVTIIAQHPRMSPHVPEMRKRLSAALGIEPARLGIKSKSTNGLGFEGRSEGIAAQAVALIEQATS
ncbi:MAG: 2-C-methyl-D-erythritol 2,4-cyclodiphosphate synthase [Chloroflexi bacterium]|nr:2-C-methyl-D-erythritol 2,4-cyclodiphosphate synthase [Chloroflexota bacterium]